MSKRPKDASRHGRLSTKQLKRQDVSGVLSSQSISMLLNTWNEQASATVSALIPSLPAVLLHLIGSFLPLELTGKYLGAFGAASSSSPSSSASTPSSTTVNDHATNPRPTNTTSTSTTTTTTTRTTASVKGIRCLCYVHVPLSRSSASSSSAPLSSTEGDGDDDDDADDDERQTYRVVTASDAANDIQIWDGRQLCLEAVIPLPRLPHQDDGRADEDVGVHELCDVGGGVVAVGMSGGSIRFVDVRAVVEANKKQRSRLACEHANASSRSISVPVSVSSESELADHDDDDDSSDSSITSTSTSGGSTGTMATPLSAAITTLTAADDGVLALLSLRDGRLLSGGRDGVVKVWRNLSHNITHSSSTDNIHTTHTITSNTINNIVQKWGDGYTVCEKVLKGHQSFVLCLVQLDSSSSSFSSSASSPFLSSQGSDGHSHSNSNTVTDTDIIIASGSRDETIKVWSLGRDRGQCLFTIEAHASCVSRLAYLGYGLMASGSWDGVIKIWSVHVSTSPSTSRNGADTHANGPITTGLPSSAPSPPPLHPSSSSSPPHPHHPSSSSSPPPPPASVRPKNKAEIKVKVEVKQLCSVDVDGRVYALAACGGGRLASAYGYCSSAVDVWQVDSPVSMEVVGDHTVDHSEEDRGGSRRTSSDSLHVSRQSQVQAQAQAQVQGSMTRALRLKTRTPIADVYALAVCPDGRLVVGGQREREREDAYEAEVVGVMEKWE